MTRNKSYYVAIVSIATIALNGYMWYQEPDKYIPDMFRNHAASTTAPMKDSCDMPDMQPAATKVGTNTVVAKAMGQDPEDGGAQQPPARSENDVWCERPNPNGSNPDKGGQDPKKVGCKCMRKTPCDANGNPSENYDTPEVRCKVHCKPDHCGCPNPCKT